MSIPLLRAAVASVTFVTIAANGFGAVFTNTSIPHVDAGVADSFREVRRIAANQLIGNFRPSLSMKELAEFVLVPGIFLQEACSEGFLLNTSARRGPTEKALVKPAFSAEITYTFKPHGSSAFFSLFGRCWFSSSNYYIAISWGEPHGPGLLFCVYPPSLTFGSSSEIFEIHHDLLSQHSDSFRKPLGYQDVFTNMFGDFPIRNVRFSEARFQNSGLFSEVYDQLKTNPCFSTETSFTSKTMGEISVRRENLLLAALTIKSGNAKQKEAEFTYADESLLFQTVRETSHSITLTLPGDGAAISFRGTNQILKEILLNDGIGPQTLRIEYRRDPISQLPMPSNITLSRENKPISEARIFRLNLSSNQNSNLFEIAKKSGAFTAEEREYRSLLVDYWQDEPLGFANPDRCKAVELRQFFKQKMRGEEAFGARLRNANIQMELSRIIGSQEFSTDFDQYLAILGSMSEPEMLLSGGLSAIDTLVIWGRLGQATELLPVLRKRVFQFCDIEGIRNCLLRSGRTGNPWGAYLLLSEPLPLKLNIEERFEIIAFKALMLYHSERLVSIAANQGKIAKSHIDWIMASVSREELHQRFIAASQEVARLYELIKQDLPTRSMELADALFKAKVLAE